MPDHQELPPLPPLPPRYAGPETGHAAIRRYAPDQDQLDAAAFDGDDAARLDWLCRQFKP